MTTKLENYNNKKTISSRIKKGAIVVASLATIVGGILGFDYITKKQNYPERDVIYRVRQEVAYAGGEKQQDENNIDRMEVTQIYQGSTEGAETKTEDVIATSERHISDDMQQYHLKDKLNTRIANASLTNEFVQSGISIRGGLNYQMQYGDVDPTGVTQTTHIDSLRDALLTYRIEPERALDEVEINVIKNDGKLELKNRLIESRSIIIGWLNGIQYRAGTTLENYITTDNDPKVKELYALIKEYNTTKSNAGNGTNSNVIRAKSDKIRVKILDKILKVEGSIPKAPVYYDFEDGVFDADFQESTKFLGFKPTLGKRMWVESVQTAEQLKEWLTLGLWQKDVYGEGVLRVENHWDFFPGNIPGLNKLRYDNGQKRVFSLFDKTNNGGYEIIDNVGTLARVDIQDFWLKYDQDKLYMYYLDKNGNGKIEKDKELIGQVLLRTTFGEKEENRSEVIGKEKDKRDITYVHYYTFMAGNSNNSVERYKDFKLCAYVESLMPDQLNKGYGRDSKLGFINEVRSDIYLYNEPTRVNISRAMTEENALVAAHDIYNVLTAAKRPYAQKFGKIVGLIPQVSTPVKSVKK